jgi:hypothetical protein
MNKRIHNRKGPNRKLLKIDVGKGRLKLEIKQAIAKRTAQDMLTAAEKKEAEHTDQIPRPRGFTPRIREFFTSKVFNRGARNR